MAKNKKEINFPMWSIIDDSLDEQALIIAENRMDIALIIEEIKKTEEKLDDLSNKINFYVRNSLNFQEYDNNKDFIFIKKDRTALIYPIELFDLSKESSQFSDENLPEPKYKVKLNKKQTEKISKFLIEFNDLAFQYEDDVEEYESMIEFDEMMIKETIDSLMNEPFILSDNNTEIEPFNSEKHELLVIKDKTSKNNKWGFKYIRKEDKEKFEQLIKNQQG
jgi:hypothetical protein